MNDRTYPITMIMKIYSTAAQAAHLDTMNDITPITQTVSTAVNKATVRQSQLHRSTKLALAESLGSVREKDMWRGR
uniref:Uncharacterized protein n=1 Tax=Hyaloperonospora arabidopsidis (strain Emoy2) TaxID=559515 RepID=M4C4T5_HYAAE